MISARERFHQRIAPQRNHPNRTNLSILYFLSVTLKGSLQDFFSDFKYFV
jgi:hypothetical protein